MALDESIFYYLYPIFVSSAGIGRTGTFIALDVLLRQAEVETQINVPETVKRLREDRVNMVQTQVTCIHNQVSYH